MERLTERLTDKSYCISDIRAIQKETFYEDMECRRGFDLYTGKAIDKLAEYEDLEEQNRLIKLPCAVGDTVYRINKGKKEPIIPMLVIGIAIRNENELVIQTKDIADDNHNLYSKNSISKTVFLTREEAEAALKELERGKGE